MNTSVRIVWAVLAGVAAVMVVFSLGMEHGARKVKRNLATECKRQQDERELLSTHQRAEGVACTYSLGGYGRAKRTRSAT